MIQGVETNRDTQTGCKDTVTEFSPWVDRKTGIEGGVAVFGSKSMPAAGGGLRIGKHLTADDAIPIARAMRAKFRLTGPGNVETGEPINGAGIIIQANPNNVSPDVILRFIQDNRLIEKGIGTAASTGVDVHGVCEALHVVHLQEPIAHALAALNHTSIESTRKRLLSTTARLQNPLSERHQRPTDVATGFAAAEITRDFMNGLRGKKIGVVGFGAVGGSFTKRASELGGEISFIANHEGAAVLDKKTLSLDTLFHSITKLPGDHVARLHLEPSSVTQLPDVLQNNPVDILVLAGPEKSITDDLVTVIPSHATIVPLANKPFASDFGEQKLRNQCLFLPSTCNVGNAVLFSLALMGHHAKTPESLLSAAIDLSQRIARSPQPIWNQFMKGEHHE